MQKCKDCQHCMILGANGPFGTPASCEAPVPKWVDELSRDDASSMIDPEMDAADCHFFTPQP